MNVSDGKISKDEPLETLANILEAIIDIIFATTFYFYINLFLNPSVIKYITAAIMTIVAPVAVSK